jgi:hypothetical protein
MLKQRDRIVIRFDWITIWSGTDRTGSATVQLGQPALELNAGMPQGTAALNGTSKSHFPNYQQVSRKPGLFMERSFDCYIDWGLAGIAMSTRARLSFDRQSATGANERTYYVAREVTAVVSSPALRYSPPWPWVIALAISCTMWVGIGWLIWTFV